MFGFNVFVAVVLGVLTTAGVFSLLLLGFPSSVKLCPGLVHCFDLRD